MKIKKVFVNNKKKSIEVEAGGKTYSLPFSRLRLKPTVKNRIVTIFIDKELGEQAITYYLSNEKDDSVHLDAFLDYNKDPVFMRNLLLYKLTLEARNLLDDSGLSKHEVIRRLNTSPSQLYRLLDTTNYKKSVDELLRLLSVLGCDVELSIKRHAV